MKPIIYFLFVGLLIGLSFSQSQAQNTVYGSGAGTIHDAVYCLEQNRSNPFSQSITIRYQVSEEAVRVGLLITNLQGVEVQRFDQLPAGAGEVQIVAGSLTPGTYVCTLFADGLLIGSHRMLLTR